MMVNINAHATLSYGLDEDGNTHAILQVVGKTCINLYELAATIRAQHPKLAEKLIEELEQ